MSILFSVTERGIVMSKEEVKENVLMVLLICVCVISAIVISYIQNEGAEQRALVMLETSTEAKNEYDGIIRFHVIANSNSEDDQQLKLFVRDSVMVQLQNRLSESVDADSVRAYIQKNISIIEKWAKNCVMAKGYDYDVKAELGIAQIPPRRYDDVFFPAGNYEALTITIGAGEGKNWWCVVFPPLCLVNSKESGYKDMFEEVGNGKLILKSKILEILRRNKAQNQPE